jgi:hypothetical protein
VLGRLGRPALALIAQRQPANDTRVPIIIAIDNGLIVPSN